MAIGLLHRLRRVVCGDHDLFHQIGKGIQVARVGCGAFGILGRFQAASAERNLRGSVRAISKRQYTRCKFVKAHCGGLSQVHGRLARVCRNLYEMVAPGEIFAPQTVFLRPEDERDAFAPTQGFCHQRSEFIEGHYGLFRFAMGQSAGSKDEGTIANGVGQGRCFLCVLSNSGAPTAERASRQWGS